jgi:hypothetical protein
MALRQKGGSVIYFDIDGVLRDLAAGALGYQPGNWNAIHNGKDFCQVVHDNLDILTVSPPTEYLECLKGLSAVTLLTSQFEHWIPRTAMWLEKHMPVPYATIYVKGPERKLAYLNEGTILIDDYPFFPSYERIALLERPYNKEVTGPCLARIQNKEDFMEVIRKYA